jgi:hypothetical protein
VTDNSAVDSNIQIAQRRQERFETYVVGLIFTLLGLSVQTATFGAAVVADVLELISWALLFVAGLAGLSRHEWIPEFFRLASLRVEKENAVRAVEKAMLQGSREVFVAPTREVVPAQVYVAEDKKAVATIEAREEMLERRQLCKYRIMKWTFVLALGTLILARGWVPAEGIVKALQG